MQGGETLKFLFESVGLDPHSSFILYSIGLIIFSSVGILTINSCRNDKEDVNLTRLLALEHSVGALSCELQPLKEKVQKIEDCIIEYDSH